MKRKSLDNLYKKMCVKKLLLVVPHGNAILYTQDTGYID